MATDEKDNQESENDGQYPPPVTPAQRKRLQKCFEHANLQARQESYDYATDMFSQCVLGDPGNVAYVHGFLGNLKQKYSNNKKGDKLAFIKSVGSKGMVKKASMQKDWAALFKHGLEVLKLNPWDVPTLTSLAHACDELELGDAQLAFLRVALEADPKDVNVNRTCARALGKRVKLVQGEARDKMYEMAFACWRRVEQSVPGDEEAARATASLMVERTITQGNYDGDAVNSKMARSSGGGASSESDLTPEQKLLRDIRRNPKELPKYVELAEIYLRADQFAKAEDVLEQALGQSDGNADIRERWEDAHMRNLRSQLADAEKQFEQNPNESERQRVQELKLQVFQDDLDICRRRVERFPNNLTFKYDLAVRYQLLGHYKEAITEYQQAVNDPKRKGLCMLALGQCFQAIKQFNLAMRHYEAAVQDIPDRDTANKKKSLYLAGKLAMGLKDVDTGERYLTTLAGMDFNYKDVSKLLDKVAEFRKNMGNAGPDGNN